MNTIRFGISDFRAEKTRKTILKIIKTEKTWHHRRIREEKRCEPEKQRNQRSKSCCSSQNTPETQKTACGQMEWVRIRKVINRYTKKKQRRYRNNRFVQSSKIQRLDTKKAFHSRKAFFAYGYTGREAADLSACAWRSWSSAAARVAAVISSPPLIRAISSMRPAKSSGRTSVSVRPSC